MARSGNADFVLTAAQCRAARAWLNWNQATLSFRSRVGTSALKDFEGEKRQTVSSIRAQLRRTFEDAGIEFPDAHSIRVRPPKISEPL